MWPGGGRRGGAAPGKRAARPGGRGDLHEVPEVEVGTGAWPEPLVEREGKRHLGVKVAVWGVPEMSVYLTVFEVPVGKTPESWGEAALDENIP